MHTASQTKKYVLSNKKMISVFFSQLTTLQHTNTHVPTTSQANSRRNLLKHYQPAIAQAARISLMLGVC